MDVPALHAAFVDQAVGKLRAHPDVVGIGLGGSWVRGEVDRYSDLDFVIAVAPGTHARVMAERRDLAAGLGPLLAAFPGDFVGEPRLLICLYGPPLLHVDLKFVDVEQMGRRVEDPDILWEREGALTRALAGGGARWPSHDLQWMEDRFWTWVHYAATKLGRGELFEVIEFLGALRTMVLGPLAATAAGGRQRAMRRIEQVAPDYVGDLRATLAAHDAASCAAALRAAVALYRRLRARLLDPTFVHRAEAEEAAVAFLEDVAAGGGPAS